MSMSYKRMLLAGASAALAGLTAGQASAATCESLSKLELPHARITLATPIVGTFNEDTAFGRAGRVYENMPAFCRVRGLATPVPGSEIEFEVWLPPAEVWTKRLHMVGNGAYSSNIYYDQMTARLKSGDVAVGTNTGHRGRELTFAIGKPESIVDYSHRAVHESVVAAKAVTKAYYQTPQKYAYFSGCSTGGYQGLSEAQRYPEDFDGIIAGAPGNNRTHLNFAFLWNYIANHRKGDDSTQIIPNAKLPMITRAVTAKCDALDGVKDGVINDPPSCPFDINSLKCKGAENDECLTAEQIETAKKIYAGPKDARTGQQLYPGFPFGSEGVSAEEDTDKPGWSGYWANPNKPTEPQRTDFFRYWVYDNPDWNWWTFNWGSDIDVVNNKIAATFNANNPDISRFKARGGKLLMFMGWQDPVGAAGEAINYYEAVEARSSAKTAEARRTDTQSFLRLFMVPGMEHCAGGPGATYFNSATRDSEPPVRDATHDIAVALEKWVETGTAPARLVATKFDNPKGENRKIVFQRPLCVYPQVVRYKGGPTDSADSFSCVMP
ncbi:MAG: tannase/feruloyl esterase family alpha/beta hydrolase [Rhodospirillaceae bacterium]|nr:tannase/feruloyl esterase family alpha/beta hydrolase [Rhodospirillaceae bacterium]